MIKSFYSLLACCAFMLAGTSASAQLSVEVWVNTDNFGYETYWSLTDELDACGGASEYAAGGNTVVGCAGCGAQAAGAADPGAYGNLITVVEGPYLLAAGNYDFHAVDDWNDGTTSYEIYVDGVLQHSIAPGGCGIATITLAPIVSGCTDPASCNYNIAANDDDGSCDGGPQSACDSCIGGPDDGTGTLDDQPDPGAACDDGDAGTTLDVIQADCSCAGQPVEIGCNDPASCNYNELSIADDGSCDGGPVEPCDTCSGEADGTGTIVDNPDAGEVCDDGNAGTINDVIQADCSCAGVPIVLGCDDPLACNFDPAANVNDASCCFSNCISLNLFDTLSDGWDGASYTIPAEDGVTVLYTGTMSGGVASETLTLCLADGCYSIQVGGGSFANEHSWSIPAANGGAGVSGIDPADQFFYIGDPAPGCVVFGCVDAGACNFDPLANVDDASCDFSCVGCTDPEGCNFDPLFTIDDGSCDYGCYGCQDPVACNFDPAATLPSNGTYGEPCCLDNCVTFNMTDSFGDGWNGNTYTITDEGGAVVASGDLDGADVVGFGGTGGGPNSGTDFLCLADGCYFVTVGGGGFLGEVGWEFLGVVGGAPAENVLVTLNTVAGCTNPLASNYDPLAGCDDGTCSFCDPGQLTGVVNMADTFGDGWNGATYTITDLDSGALVAFGSLDFAESGDGVSSGFDIICLDPGCYEWNVGGADPEFFDSELVWDLTLDDGTIILSGAEALSGFGFVIGGAVCDISGCTDPVCFNYNQYAITDDGSCVCPPANDLCENAEAVICDGSYFGSTTLASADLIDELGVGVDCGGETVTGPGVWYQFDGDGSQVTAALCASSYDTKMFVFSGSCGALDCVGANDDGCPVGLQSQFTFTTLADGTDYYIYVTGFGTATGDYTLDISCSDCDGVVIPNDECDNAITQISGIPFEGSMCCVNPDEATLCTPAFQTPYAVWFKMNSEDFDTFDFTLNNGTSSSGFTDGGANIGLAIFVDDTGTGDCSALTELACCGPITGTCAGDISAITALLPFTDYYFMVYTTDASACGGYTFTTETNYVGCTDPLACNYCDICGVSDPLACIYFEDPDWYSRIR